MRAQKNYRQEEVGKKIEYIKKETFRKIEKKQKRKTVKKEKETFR